MTRTIDTALSMTSASVFRNPWMANNKEVGSIHLFDETTSEVVLSISRGWMELNFGEKVERIAGVDEVANRNKENLSRREHFVLPRGTSKSPCNDGAALYLCLNLISDGWTVNKKFSQPRHGLTMGMKMLTMRSVRFKTNHRRETLPTELTLDEGVYDPDQGEAMASRPFWEQYEQHPAGDRIKKELEDLSPQYRRELCALLEQIEEAEAST